MDREKALERIGVGSAVILLGFVAGASLEYFVKVVLARFLGPDSYGVFVQGLAIAQVAAVIALFGLHKSLPRFMSYYRGREEGSRIEGSFATSLYIVIPSSIVATVALYFSARWLSLSVFSEPALVQPLQFFSLSIVPLTLFYLTIAFMRGMQNAKYKVYVEDFVLPVVEILLILAFFYLGYGLMGAVYAYLVALVATVLAGYYFYSKLSAPGLRGAELIPRKILRFSWPLFLVSVLVVVNKWTDVIILGWIAESQQVGVYEVALSIAGVLTLLLSSLGYMFMPVVSELYGKGDISEILEIYRTTTRWIFTVTLPVFAGMILFPSEILQLLFGSSYTAGAVALMILAAGHFYSVSVGLAGTILISAGKTFRFLVGVATVTGLNVPLNLLLIPRYGIVGAGVATAAALVAGNTVLLWFAGKRVGGLPYSRRYLQTLPSIVVSSAVVYGIDYILQPGIAGSVVLGAILVIVYFSMLYVLGGVQEEDFTLMRNLWGSIRR